MLNAYVYNKPRTSGRVLKSTKSLASTTTSRSTRSHVTREREREDGNRPGNHHPASVRDDSVSRVATRSIAASQDSAAHRDHLTRSIAASRVSSARRNHLTIRASTGHGGTASTSGRASRTLRSIAGTYSRRTQSGSRNGVLLAADIIPSGASGTSQRSSAWSVSS